jgi:hypothetical protein
MPSDFDQLLKQAQGWAERAAADGWLTHRDTRPLEELDSGTPASLFEAGTHRPLVAAFFGGTGVGKSTLLNRLAGQPIARTGVERPTSREVSVYLHESVQLRNLPKHFPLEQVRIAQHHDERRRQVLWIDMPDIDSIEQHNRELVLEWLPHIDVLIYVVSPERYRDDKGWRLLQAHGGDHAWLFVINQWDRGHEVQYEDFSKLLAKGGFQDPIILRTDSREHAASRKEDDFERLQGFLQEMADQHVIRQLEIRAESLRLDALRAGVAACLEKLGEGAGYKGLGGEWERLWEEAQAELLKGLEWPIQAVARAFVGHEANPLRRSIDLTRNHQPEPPAEASRPAPVLWDDWAQGRLQDALDRLVVEAGNRGLPAIPLKADLDRLFAESGRTVLNEGQLALRKALANPGNALQRIGLKVSGALAVLLPLGAIGWASWQVVKGYYESALQHLHYLGTDFAIHSTLLILLSWLLPFFVYHKLKPSAERTAVKGLRSGIAAALGKLGGQVDDLLARSEEQRQAVMGEGERIAEQAGTAAPETYEGQGLLERVLPKPVPGSREAAYSIRSK